MADCSNVELYHALSIWWTGVKLDNYCVYGLNTVWWGRIAKCMALLSGITLLIDLIGEERIREIMEGPMDLLEKKRERFLEELQDTVDRQNVYNDQLDFVPFWKRPIHIMVFGPMSYKIFYVSHACLTIYIYHSWVSIEDTTEWMKAKSAVWSGVISSFIILSIFVSWFLIRGLPFIVFSPAVVGFTRLVATIAFISAFAIDLIASS